MGEESEKGKKDTLGKTPTWEGYYKGETEAPPSAFEDYLKDCGIEKRWEDEY